jgi:p-aminobenzoyl-glutamate transporter AbgT
MVMGNASAKEIGLDDFTGNNSNPVDGLGDAKGPMSEVVIFVIALFLFTCIIAIFGSGSLGNLGSVLHNVSLRSKGIGGVITVLGVVLAVIMTLVLFFHLYNKYLIGSA